MAIDLRTLGSKLAKYRGQLEESVAEVALSTGIDAVRLASIEAGQTEPTGDEVLILSDHYRCDFKFFPTSRFSAKTVSKTQIFASHLAERDSPACLRRSILAIPRQTRQARTSFRSVEYSAPATDGQLKAKASC